MPRKPPPYQVVLNHLRERLAAGEWRPGERLPSRAALCREYGVGDNVVRRATDVLEREAVLEGRPGSGIYVCHPRKRVRLVRSRHDPQANDPEFDGELAGSASRPGRELKSRAEVPASEEIAARLGIQKDETCLLVEYENLADGKSVEFCRSWQPKRHAEGGGRSGKGSRRAPAISHAVERVEPRYITDDEEKSLGVKEGMLVTRIIRTFIDLEGRPVRTEDIFVPPMHCEVVYEIPLAGQHLPPGP